MNSKEHFNGKCPYTDKQCESWNCSECEIEQAEQKYMNSQIEIRTQYDKLVQEMTIDKMTCLLREVGNTGCCDYCALNDDDCVNDCYSGTDCYRGIRLFLESEVKSNESNPDK